MLSRMFFREHGQVIRTRPLIADWAWPVAAVVMVMALFGLAGHLDKLHEDEATLTQLRRDAAMQRAFEAGRQHGHAEMVATAEAAWQAAQAEAEQRCVPVRRMP